MPFCGWVLTQAAPQWPRGPGQRAGGQVPWGSWLCKDPRPLQAGSHPTAHCMLVGSGPRPPAWKAGPGEAAAAGCLADGSWSPAPAGPGPASERGWRRGRVRGGKEGAPAGPPVCMWPAPRLAGQGSGSEPGSRGPARSARPQGTFSAALPGAPGGRPAVQPAHALFAAPPGLLCCGGTSAARAPGSVLPVAGRHSDPRIFFCAPGGQD